MAQPLPPETEAAIRAAAKENKIHAIKLYREATGAGLAEAKEAVEKMEAESRAQSGLPTNMPAKGCLGLVMAGTVVAAAFAFRHLLS